MRLMHRSILWLIPQSLENEYDSASQTLSLEVWKKVQIKFQPAKEAAPGTRLAVPWAGGDGVALAGPWAGVWHSDLLSEAEE